jgi:flagellar hook-associated protein 1 FlgK
MSVASLFHIGKSALTASQAQLGVTGNNIANINTPGYSRQEVILNITAPLTQVRGSVGQGVSVAGIKRNYSSFLQNQINLAQQDYGQFTTMSQTLNQVEQIFNEVQNLGLATPLAVFFNAWQDVANNPPGLTERDLLLQKADALADAAVGMEQNLKNILKQTQTGITESVTQINALASKIARLNGQIGQVEAGSSITANDLRDQRDAALKDLSNLVELSSWEDKNNGVLTVNLGMKTLVGGNTAKPISLGYGTNGDYTLLLDGQNITTRITKGELGGLLIARQDIEANLLSLRKLAAAITNTVNLQHALGYGLDGSTRNNFFNPLQLSVQDNSAGADLTATIIDYSQLTLNEYSIGFNGSHYEIYDQETGALKSSGAYDSTGTIISLEGIQFAISGSVTDRDHFTVSPLITAIQTLGTFVTSAQQIAASGTATGLPGDNTNALALAGLMDRTITTLNSQPFANYYQTLVGQVGSQSRAASDELKFSDNFLTRLNSQREAISGVNMDEEAANLIRFQRAYEAGARLIKTADELFQTLLNL